MKRQSQKSRLRDWLIRLRKERGLMQGEVATILGVSRTSYNRVELGMRELGALELLKLQEKIELKNDEIKRLRDCIKD